MCRWECLALLPVFSLEFSANERRRGWLGGRWGETLVLLTTITFVSPCMASHPRRLEELRGRVSVCREGNSFWLCQCSASQSTELWNPPTSQEVCCTRSYSLPRSFIEGVRYWQEQRRRYEVEEQTEYQLRGKEGLKENCLTLELLLHMAECAAPAPCQSSGG